MDNKTMLLVLMIVLIVLLVLMAVLGIVFIIALRKRAPVIKVLMAPPAASDADNEQDDEEEDEDDEPLPAPVAEPVVAETAAAEPVEEETAEPAPAPVAEEPVEIPETVPEEIPESDDDDNAVYVTEGQQRVRYDRSMLAKVTQMKDESKDWYSQIKNELLSYQRVKGRMSWKREAFRIGRTPVARFTIRGKTLCLLLAVDPAGFNGTKYTVEDVSNVAATADTPCQYRIKSVRRVKYAKEIIAAVMKELGIYKNPNYVAQDYFIPYEGTMSLMQRGLIKRIVTGSSRVFEIREVNAEEVAVDDDAQTETAATETAEDEVAAAEAPATENAEPEAAEEPAKE